MKTLAASVHIRSASAVRPTAAHAAGVSPTIIRVCGRWSSDVYMLYTRLTREAAGLMSTTIGSTPFHDLERGAGFVSEELELLSSEVDVAAMDVSGGADLA